MKPVISLISILIIVFLSACGGTKEAVVVAPPVDYEEETLDTMTVVASPITPEEKAAEEKEIPNELPVYNSAEPRLMDLIHTSLDLRFDWENQYVLGKASLTMSPVFYPQDQIILDAKGFEIHQIELAGQKLEYDYDGKEITVNLPKTYTRNDTLVIDLDYTAKPNEGPVGGSAAITSDKGLFFIDPLDTDPEKPSQIWTQGETEHNSKWFPTFDQPNERTTQEVKITVDNKYRTLSNGTMTNSIDNGDGTRTDIWQMNRPHAPYLFMLAIGDYAVVEDKWNEIPLAYYVEPAYKPYAAQIFNYTPEMLTFFSELLNYPYPWDKYAQVVCRDYVSGAMENTTAVIFGEFVQKTDRELIDNDNDYIVAHEMFHHWFGDLVTCESWANLTLQEGFANYSEYLWYEEQYGRERADAHRQNEMEGYLMSAENQGTHPLIYYGYGDKEEMFDAHSYNKGGLVLHMLRRILGDEAFFTSLNKYLKDNAYSAVEVDELRMAFEDVTGMDLQWFFDQWYLSEGHPTLDVNYAYDLESRSLKIDVDQIQDPENHLAIFRLEVDLAIYDQAGNQSIYPLTVDQRSQGFIIEDIEEPATIVFDGTDSQLAVINERKTSEQYLAQYRFSSLYKDKYQALTNLKFDPLFAEIQEDLIDEEYYTFRVAGIESLRSPLDSVMIEQLFWMVENDPHSAVRNAALNKLVRIDYALVEPLLANLLQEDSESYLVVASALNALRINAPQLALKYADQYREVKAGSIVSALADIYARTGDATYLDYFQSKLSSVSIFSMFNFYTKYADLVSKQGPVQKLTAVEALSDISKNGDNLFRKFVATSTINKIKNSFVDTTSDEYQKVSKILQNIIDEETNEGLLSRYQSF